jgi:predicted dithiol-disulfide oxidoreductase (DUF899 family)
MNEVPHPPVVSRDRWLDARKKLLAQEKELTRQYDRVNAERRRLPMVRIEKNYRFEGPGGVLSLKDLFEGRQQLVVYHFMFDPAWEKGCPSCTSYANSIGDLGMLHKCDTTFVMVSRAPLSKLEAYKERQGWRLPWVSSFGSDFNYDFHVTNDETIAPVEYNYRNKAELEANKVPNAISGEEHGLSVFFRIDDEVFHTYSAYARGTEALTYSRAVLDMTPYGRQQDFEDSPPGWPQKPTYG